MVVPLANGLWSCMFWTYALYNSFRNKIYIGQTQDLDQRIKRHNGELVHNKASFTAKNYGNWIVIHREEFNSRHEAMQREKELKTQKGREYIWNIIR